MTTRREKLRSKVFAPLGVATAGAVLNVISRPFILWTTQAVHDVLVLLLFIDIGITGLAVGLVVWILIPEGSGPGRAVARAFGALLAVLAATFIGFIWSFAIYGAR
jgi:hypothetical protein